MTVEDIVVLCYGEQKVIIWMVYGNAHHDTIEFVGTVKELRNRKHIDLLSKIVGHMYTRDDGFLSMSVTC